MNEVEKRKCRAIEIAHSINPEAEVLYTTNQFGHKLCNGLLLEDCSNLCAAVDEELTREGRLNAAKIIHEIPLFVFAMLSKEEVKEFVSVWTGKED